MLQLAEALTHVVEGAAQFRQFVAAGHRQALAVAGDHGLNAVGEPAQGFGQALRDQPADRQGRRRAEQEYQDEQVAD
jgi:hypothetical protein